MISKCFSNVVLWESRNGAVQIFFLTPSDICWKICKVKNAFGCVVGAYFFNVELVEVDKKSEVF